MSTTTPPPADDSAVIGLAAILVDAAVDAATIRPLVPGVPVMTFDEVLDDDEAPEALEEADVIALVPGGADAALLARANDATRKARDVAHEARAVVVGPWKAGTPFPTPRGIDTPGSFLAWAGSFPPLEPPPSSHQGNGKALAATVNASVPALAWGEPKPVRHVMPSAPPMVPDMIPPPLRDWLDDIADRTSCPLDYPAVGAVISLATIVGRKIGIRPKRYDDWTVVPNLWGCIVGRPGMLKTPTLTETTKPLRRLEAEARKRHAEAMAEYEAMMMVASVQADAAKKAMKDAAKKAGVTSENLLALARESKSIEPPAAPVLRRYFTSDVNVETLGEILRDNPTGTCVLRDELPGWIKGFDKSGRESERAFFLECWNGNGMAHTVDRIGRGCVRIENPCVSVLGGMQPGPLRELIRDTAKGGGGDDGFLPRLQLLVWPDPGEFRNVDRWPDTAAKNRAYEVFQALDRLTAEDVGAGLHENDDDVIPYLRFSPEAQERFDAWRVALESRLREPGIEPLMEAHLSKYRSLLPSLALLFHLANVVDGAPAGPVNADALALAERWCGYLESHAQRAYDILNTPDMEAATALSERIKNGELPSPFTQRDVYRHCWSRLDTPDATRRAVAALEGLGWVQAVETTDTGGRPREEIHIHPSLPRKGGKIADTRPDPTDKTDKSPPGPPFVSFVSAPPVRISKNSAPAETPATLPLGDPEPRASSGKVRRVRI